ncbi:MAG: ABC-F family ATP-binding cassette domain-containing protein [Acidobacteriota bacterium]|nr:ABC-F family ATP-binding cassette domain-containing protein [Acidobacteriota bacterium]
MPVLLNCHRIGKRYAGRPIFDNVSVSVSEGDRLGVIGPNGSGKSTLLQILSGRLDPDDGSVSLRKGTRLGYVAQDTVFPDDQTIQQVLAGALANLELDPEEEDRRMNTVLGKAGFENVQLAAKTLSGGWRRRLGIARELIRAPDLLLLDEPTNHLDLEGILWLEKLILNARFASVIVSHDRYFLENVSNRMSEINRTYPEGTFTINGSYSYFLEKREAFLTAQSRQQEALTNRVQREIEWLRRGAKARTGKSKARIQAAGALSAELADVKSRNQKGTAQIDFTATERKTKRLLSVEGVAKKLGGKELFGNVSFSLSPGTRLGLLGGNGTGKTTLLRILNDEATPDSGRVEKADGLRVVYFDQGREQLDPEVPLRRAMSPEGDTVIFQGQPIHIASWSKRFLFRPDQLDLPVGRLSGGEQARVLISRLVLRPADVLLLDEPTNDLDIPTLEVLEENLMEFAGAIVLVTHDRYLLDRVSTIVLALDGKGGSEFFADYPQWEQSREWRKPVKETKDVAPERTVPPDLRKRLSYKENREWEQMEERIHAAEEKLTASHDNMQAPDTVSDPARMASAYEDWKADQSAVDELYARWAELEAKR